MKRFKEFLDKKSRSAKKELSIVKKVLEHEGLSATDHLDADDPFVFVRNTSGKLSFEGIRIYKIGNDLAYRVQKEEKTHPYGKAYSLGIEEIFEDLISEMDEEKAGKQVMKALAEELKSFFKKSSEAEKQLRSSEMNNRNGNSPVSVRDMGTDYSNTVYTSM